MSSESLPQFYSAPIPLNSSSHGDMTLGASPGGYRFADQAHAILLASAEFFEACRQFPILFVAPGNGPLMPVALTGVEPGKNLFVDEQGRWLAQYIPAYVRRYPFITTSSHDGQVTVCFDESFDGLNQPDGMPLFENGAPSQVLQGVQAFLADYGAQMQLTEQFCGTLAQTGLLRPIEVRAGADGEPNPLQGFLAVDEQQLAQLPDIDITRLFRSGMLALIHAHLLSLRTLGDLGARAAAARIAAS